MDYVQIVIAIIAFIALLSAYIANRYQAIGLIINLFNNSIIEANHEFRRSQDVDLFKSWSRAMSAVVSGIQQFYCIRNRHILWILLYPQKIFKDVIYLSLDTTIRREAWTKDSFGNSDLDGQILTFREFFKEQKRWDEKQIKL